MFTDREMLAEMPKLRKFAQKLARNNAECEDLLQSTLLRAIEKRSYFETDTKLFSWMSKIMFNLFVTDYRRKVKFESQYDPESELMGLSLQADQDTKLEFKRTQEAMARLSAEHKEVLVLVCVKGIKYQDAADMLRIPVGTVRSRLSRARAELSSLMGYDDNREDDVPAALLMAA